MLHDRVALVTGGTRGLGFAIADAFVGAGATVFITGRSADTCAGVVARLSRAGGSASFIVTDVMSAAGSHALNVDGGQSAY